MQIEVNQKELYHLLYLTSTIANRRNTMPIVGNVKLTAGNGTLQVLASDLCISLLGDMDANVLRPGTLTVDAKFIYEIVKELPEEVVHISSTEDCRLEIVSGNSRFKVSGAASSEYPSINGLALINPVSVDAPKLHEMINNTLYAISTDDTRVNITGVCAELLDEEGQKNKLRFIGTDGHRLAIIDRVIDGFDMLTHSVIIPKKGVQEIKKLLEGNEGVAYVAINNGFFTVKSKRVILGVGLINGEFPNYRRHIPTEFKTSIDVDRLEFLSVARRVALVTTENARNVILSVNDSDLRVSCCSEGFGEAVENMHVRQDGDNVTVAFNARYLVELISAMTSSETVNIKLNGEKGSGVFVGDGDPLYMCVVMPVRFEQG
ncbi:MAG: DNA polymerase III subunit beta [Deltaproteobacteria bacterium]|nr:DNA polymerase III subunit beta [Deltaproteobacteria bacterium]